MALANAFSGASIVFYILFYLVSLLVPSWFGFLFNSLVFGADVASLYPKHVGLFEASEYATVIAIAAWVFGFVFGWLYNYSMKMKEVSTNMAKMEHREEKVEKTATPS